MKTTISHKEQTRFLSNGQPLRPFITRNTRLPVMCGHMGVCSMRYGVWDTSHLKNSRIMKLVNLGSSLKFSYCLYLVVFHCH